VTRAITPAILLAALVSVGASGCRTAHLGPDTGAAYRDALDGQRDSGPDGPGFDADTARGTLAARRRAPTRAPAERAMTIVPIAAPTATVDRGDEPIAIEAR
jgi:hypothetical protein